MKKSRKILLIILMLVLILATIAFIGFSPVLSMNPVETGQIPDTDIIAVKNNRNSLFFIPVNDGYIAIDAGSEADKIEESMAQIDIDTKQVKYVLLTHTDYDHVAALAKFTDAQIYMSQKELQMLDGKTKRNIFSRNSLPANISLDSLILLSDGEEMDVGGRMITCIETPGHTVGSMSYLIDEKYLFTGDAFKVDDGAKNIHPFTMDKITARSSIEKIAHTIGESQLVFTAHYGYFNARLLK